VAVDQDRRLAAVARANLGAVGQGRALVICQEARRWLAPGPASDADRFDRIYLDPPWPDGLHVPISGAVAAGGWLAPGGLLVWECPSEAAPAIPAGWVSRPPRRYGGSTVLLLEQEGQPVAPHG
jgi:16S rRNA (guanine966-N2)-methyltransferase